MGHCSWAYVNDRERHYHDTEWGVPVHDDRQMFEHLTLENLQCGLSWDLMLKKRGFKYIGTVTIYSHLQACGMVNDHAEDCPCFHQINASHPCIHLPPDQEAQLMTLRNMPQKETED